MPRHLTSAGLTHPLPIEQRAHDFGRHRDSAYILDITPGNRLAISNNRKGFQQSSRVPRRPALPERTQSRGIRGTSLKTKAARHLNKFNAAAGVVTSELF